MKKMKIAALALAICIAAVPITAKAKDFIYNKKVNSNKVWTVKLSNDVDWQTIDKGISVVDSNGNKVLVTAALGENNKTIVILPPQNGYKLNESYTLTLNNNLKTKRGTALKENAKLNFSTVSYEESNNYIAEANKKATVTVEAFDGLNNKIHTSTGIVVDGKVVANYNALDKAYTATITMLDGTKYDIGGVYSYNVKSDLVTLKVNAADLPSYNLNGLSNITIGNKTSAVSQIREMLKVNVYKSLIQMKREVYSTLDLEKIEENLWQMYGNNTISNGTIGFNNIMVLNNEQDSSQIDVYLVLREDKFKSFWNTYNVNKAKFKEDLEKTLSNVHQYVAYQYGDKMVKIKVVADYSSSENIASLNGKNIYYNNNSGIWTIYSTIIDYTKLSGYSYCTWNNSFK